MSKPLTLTTAEIRRLLHTRYSGDEWFFRFEVSNGAGMARTRSADAIAMNLWPSHGHVLHGFEIKATRQDWTGELKKPAKSEAFFPHVDFWWLVAPRAIVKESEIPEDWGWLAASPKQLRAVKDAPRLLPEGEKSFDVLMHRTFVASLIRKPPEGSDAHKIAIEEAVKKARAQKDYDWESRIKDLRRRHDEVLRWKTDFEKAFGMKVQDYRDPSAEAKELIQAKKFLAKIDGYTLSNIEREAKQLVKQVQSLRDALDPQQMLEGIK